MKIIHFQRKSFQHQYSIEGLFRNYRNEMSRLGIEAMKGELPFYSKGFWPRIKNMLWAFQNSGDINHITGDVHYIALTLSKRHNILTVHDLELLERNRGFKRWLLKLLWFDLPISRVSKVTVISEATKAALIKYCPAAEDKIAIIPNSINHLFSPAPKRFTEDRPLILQFGSKPNKNMARVAEALSGIPCHLIVLGQVTAENELKNNNISYETRQGLSDQELVDLYRECDMVSFVSTYEGFGLPIVEAQVTERPVVTSNCSSMPEVAGQGACFVDPFDVNSIRNGFLRVINDSEYREQIISAGRENRKRFDLNNIVQAYLELYQELLNSK